MKKFGFTLVEILACIAIISIVFAIAFPAFRSAKEAAKHSDTTQSLSQLGKALLIYRADWEADPQSPDSELLGFPPTDSREAFEPYMKFGQKYRGPTGQIIRIWYPKSKRLSSTIGFDAWSRYVKQCSSTSILLGDFTFNDFDPIKQPKGTAFGIGLRLDGSVSTQTHSGTVVDPFWWECK